MVQKFMKASHNTIVDWNLWRGVCIEKMLLYGVRLPCVLRIVLYTYMINVVRGYVKLLLVLI